MRIKATFKKKILLIMLSSFCITPLLPQEKDVIFKKLLIAWHNFDNFPSSDNAIDLINILPQEPVNFSLPLFEVILESETFRKLEINAFSGDRNSVRILFRMLNVSDGAAGEYLSIELGLLIRIAPRIFLDELKNNRIFVPRIEPLVANYGPFMGDEKAIEHERLLRIKSIEI